MMPSDYHTHTPDDLERVPERITTGSPVVPVVIAAIIVAAFLAWLVFGNLGGPDAPSAPVDSIPVTTVGPASS